MTQKRAVLAYFSPEFFILEDGNDRLSRNVGKELPIVAAKQPRRAQFSTSKLAHYFHCHNIPRGLLLTIALLNCRYYYKTAFVTNTSSVNIQTLICNYHQL
jgi:hypothetical protein